MKYTISNPSFSNVSEMAKNWLRRGRRKLLLEIRSASEVRLVPYPSAGAVALSPQDLPGCTVSISGGCLLVHCSTVCLWLEKALVGFLQGRGLIGQGQPVTDCPRFARRHIVHDHTVGRPVSHKVLERARAEREARRALKTRRFRSVREALCAAEREAAGWVIVTRRAHDSAADSDYRDPDYIFDLVVDLGRAAEQNSTKGLSGDWRHHLAASGGHDFVPTTSKNTLAMFPDEYHVMHNGRPVCIGAHVRCGMGSGQDLARIYLALPESPGAPVILGHVGSHLSLPGRK